MAVSDASQIRLSWPGKQESPEAPMAALELTRTGNARCELICGENLSALRALARERAGQVTLAYLDPPFFTGKTHVRVTRRREGRGKILRSTAPAFDDHWESLPAFLQALRDRVALCRELLANHGSLVLHVDPKTSHYAKVVCDEVFGPRCFASEIIWRYRRWPSKTKNFQRVHDVLLRFVKDPRVEPRFCQMYEPLAASTVATWGTQRQRAVVGSSGVRTHSSRTAAESPGAPLGDVWEIGIIGPVARERTGYPTQKPEALLERLLTSCSGPDDLVLDPYAGSGTTLAVGVRLGRRVIGIDSSEEALDVIRQRLAPLQVEPRERRVREVQERAEAPARRARAS
ncbi:MAG TPA: site-specific DNA-methyltransferase [Polyangiaceae bacterium]|nr:site-specific DNA-methyltransferase [Polyangiaceae bacterium]